MQTPALRGAQANKFPKKIQLALLNRLPARRPALSPHQQLIGVLPQRAAHTRSSLADTAIVSQGSGLSADDDEICAPATVIIDNNKNPNFSVMTIEVMDYPGLLRVVAWVLNGLEMVAQNAVVSTTSDGVALNTFWLSTRAGKKLKDAAAEALAERVREYLTDCAPSPAEGDQTEFAAGPISVSNTAHTQYTVLTLQEKSRTPGFLLEVASVLSALNVQIYQAVIQGCVDCGEDVPQLPYSSSIEEGARVFQFWVNDQDGKKLDPEHVRALLYTLGVGLGFSGFKYPTSPPNKDVHAYKVERKKERNLGKKEKI